LPSKPRSSEKTAKDEVGMSFGDELQMRVWVPSSQPLPKLPPDPMAIVDWMMWYPAPSGSVVGSISVSDPLALVVVQHGPGKRRRTGGQSAMPKMIFHGRPAKKIT
jgi:hypothetical protein